MEGQHWTTGAGNTTLDAKRRIQEDFPQFLPFHLEMLRTLGVSSSSSSVVNGADRSADDNEHETAVPEMNAMWNLIDSFVTGRMSLMQIQKESMVACGVFDRAVALLIQKNEGSREDSTGGSNTGATTGTGTTASTTQRKHGTSPSSVNKKRRTSYGCFRHEESKISSRPANQHHHLVEEESNPMHVIVRFLGCRRSIANTRLEKQVAQYQSIRSWVKTRKNKLQIQLKALQGSMHEERQHFIQHLLTFDLYKIKPSSPPVAPSPDLHVKKRSEMERLQTELTLWSLLEQDIERVFGSCDQTLV